MFNFNGFRNATKEMITGVEARLKEASQREKELRAELAGLRSFLDTHDDCDQSQIKAEVDDINDNLHEFACATSYLPLWSEFAHTMTEVEAEDARKNLRPPILSRPLLRAMTACQGHEEHLASLILQYAIKTAFNYHISKMMAAFCCAVEGSLDQALLDMAADTLRREIQPVYGRWRAVTHKSARLSLLTEERTEYLSKIADELATQIYYCGCLIFSRRINVEEFQDLTRTLEEGLLRILTATVAMSDRLKEDVITKEYIAYGPPTRKYDARMIELPYQPTAPLPVPDSIAGLLRIGMLSRSKSGREDSEIQDVVWIKPQVITESMLKEILVTSNESSAIVPPTRPHLKRYAQEETQSREDSHSASSAPRKVQKMNERYAPSKRLRPPQELSPSPPPIPATDESLNQSVEVDDPIREHWEYSP